MSEPETCGYPSEDRRYRCSLPDYHDHDHYSNGRSWPWRNDANFDGRAAECWSEVKSARCWQIQRTADLDVEFLYDQPYAIDLRVDGIGTVHALTEGDLRHLVETGQALLAEDTVLPPEIAGRVEENAANPDRLVKPTGRRRCGYPTWDGYVGCDLPDHHDGYHRSNVIGDRWGWRQGHDADGWAQAKASEGAGSG